MKEARIECITPEFPIHDLGLKLRKGDVIFKPEADARASKDLEAARRIGAVQVRYVQRSRMTKKEPRNPPPPNVRLPRRVKRQPPPSPPVTVDMDEIRRVAREEARAGAREGVQEALASLPSTNIDQATLEAALRNVLPTGAIAAPVASSPSSAGPDEPVYIPSNIVDPDAKTNLETKSSEDDAGDLDGAAAALKAAKGPTKKRTPRKKKPVTKET